MDPPLAALLLLALALLFILLLAATQPSNSKPMRYRTLPPLIPNLKLKLQHEITKEVPPLPPPFRFTDLPAELQLLILGHCADSMRTYRALVLVSRAMHYATLRACIPLLPITLISTHELASFSSFLSRRLRPFGTDHIGTTTTTTTTTTTRTSVPAGALVASLWITPLETVDEPTAQHILASCPHVRDLACDASTLTYALGLASRHRHTRLTRLTLLFTHRGWEHTLAATPQGTKILSRLTHLRVMGSQLVPNADTLPHQHHQHHHHHHHHHHQQPPAVRMENLTHLSYFEPHTLSLSLTLPIASSSASASSASSPSSSSCETTDDRRKPDLASTPRTLFPALLHTVVTRRWDPLPSPSSSFSAPAKPTPAPKRFAHDVVLFHIPREFTEVELWTSTARGKSIWDFAADAVPVADEEEEKEKT